MVKVLFDHYSINKALSTARIARYCRRREGLHCRACYPGV